MVPSLDYDTDGKVVEPNLVESDSERDPRDTNKRRVSDEQGALRVEIRRLFSPRSDDTNGKVFRVEIDLGRHCRIEMAELRDTRQVSRANDALEALAIACLVLLTRRYVGYFDGDRTTSPLVKGRA